METNITDRAISDFQDAWKKLSDIAKFNIGNRGTGRTTALVECFSKENSLFVDNGGAIVVDSSKTAERLMHEHKCRAISVKTSYDGARFPVIFDHFVIECAVGSGLAALRTMKAAIDVLRFNNQKLEYELMELRKELAESKQLYEDACQRNQGGVPSDSES